MGEKSGKKRGREEKWVGEGGGKRGRVREVGKKKGERGEEEEESRGKARRKEEEEGGGTERR